MAAPELRAAGPVARTGRTLAGTVVRYGDVARTRAGLERFTPGAFGNVAELDTILTWQHDPNTPLARTGGGGLTLADSPDQLRFRAELPPTAAANDALVLVRMGVLRGASMSFVPLEEHVDPSGVRVVTRAGLPALGIVDQPAYPASTVEARQRVAVSASGDVALGTSLACRCRDGCETIRLEPGAFDRALAEVEAGTREVTAFVTGEFGTPVASTRSGMRLRSVGGVLSVAIPSMLGVAAVADLVSVAEGSFLAFRPYFPDATSTAEKRGTEFVVTDADLRAIEIATITGPTDGLERIALEGDPEQDADTGEDARRYLRRRVWL